jgi:4-hydroxybenzoate polyprenyltransferase
MQVRAIIRLARPGHWIKNLIVLLPVVFALQIHNVDAWAKAFTAAIVFCLVSSFTYILNDIKDRRSDLAHPTKKNRPLASGQLSVKTAVIEAVIFLLLAAIVTQKLSLLVVPIILAYIFLQLSYTMFLKDRVLVDVICIALGFVFRAAGGAVAIKAIISPWLFIGIFTICLFMGFCKRYSEVVTISDKKLAESHRPTLVRYTPDLLMHLITLSAGIAVTAFLFYGLSERTVAQFGTNYFIYTLPLVVYAVFRFAMLSMEGTYSDPTDLILHDRPFQTVTSMWVIAAMYIIYWGKDLLHWIHRTYY